MLPEAATRPLQNEESLGTMSTYKNLMTVCCAAVLALGLAACGSSDDDKKMTMPDDGMEMPDDGMEMPGDGMEPTALETATELAGRLEDMDFEQAQMDAIKYAGMLSSESVKGDSAKAAENAGKVLMANMAIEDAVTQADNAIAEIETAMGAAEDIENAAEKDAVMRLLDDALETANTLKEDAQALIDAPASPGDTINTLGEAVAAVTGDDEDMPNTAADAGEAVAALVKTALCRDHRYRCCQRRAYGCHSERFFGHRRHDLGGHRWRRECRVPADFQR